MLDIDGGLRERKTLRQIEVLEAGGSPFSSPSMNTPDSRMRAAKKSRTTRILIFVAIGVFVSVCLFMVFYQSSEDTHDVSDVEHDDHYPHVVEQHHEQEHIQHQAEHHEQETVQHHDEHHEQETAQHHAEPHQESEHHYGKPDKYGYIDDEDEIWHDNPTERHHSADKEEHDDDHHAADPEKRDAVVKAFLHAWHAYEHDAFGSDEYHPLSHSGSNFTRDHGFGYTIVDALDTMFIMNLTEEYSRARKWIEKDLSFEIDGIYNVFETTIRVLGGLLSAYHLTDDKLYKDRAIDLADRLMVAFDPHVTESGLPATMVNLGKRLPILDSPNHDWVSVSEVATLQLEFRYLTHLTGNHSYWNAVENVMVVIDRAMDTFDHHSGLAPIIMNPHTGQFEPSTIRLGSRGDSFYEYLLKQFLQTGGTEHRLWEMYERSMDGIHDHLLMRTPHDRILHTGELVVDGGQPSGRRITSKQDHLVCFLGGSLMLGTTTHNGTHDAHDLRDWNTGVELIEGCMETHKTATGLSPEIAHFRGAHEQKQERDWYIKGGWDARYSLRPETVESLFIAYRLSGEQRYRDWGWEIFQAIEHHCKIPIGGYASVVDVDRVPVILDDKQETFFLSETLKYLYLLFEDTSVIPLHEFVFNTEAHPLPIFEPGFQTKFS